MPRWGSFPRLPYVYSHLAILVWILAAAALGPAACSPKTPPLIPDSTASADPEVEEKFRYARDAFDAGKYEASDQAFSRLFEEHREDPLARLALIYRARIALAKSNPKGAREYLAKLTSGKDTVAERALFYDGVAMHGLEKHDAALERLEPFVGRFTDPAENLLLLDTLWRAARAAGKPALAIEWLDSFLAHSPDGSDRQGALISLKEVVDTQTDVRGLEKLSQNLRPDESAWPLVMARLAKLHFEQGRLEEATEVLEKVDAKSRGDEPIVKDVASAVEQRVAVDFNAVGCIVPLSKRSRLVGETVLKGAMLGARKIPIGDERRLSVTIRDSASDPERAVVAVEELVLNEHVAAIIGPMDGAAALAAAKRAEQLGVPMLALSTRDGIPQGKRHVFRHFATYQSETRALAEAAADQGFKRFAILYPDNGYGRTMRRLMASELKGRKLTLAVEIKYSPTDAAFVEVAEGLARTEFEALFVPDIASRVALVAPALAAAGIWSTPQGAEPPGPGRAVQLLFPSSGRAPDLIRRAGRYLEGALFATFSGSETSLGGAAFAEKFRAEYSAEPSYLSAFGHDAVVLVAGAIRSGAVDRNAIREWIGSATRAETEALQLATPFDGFDESGEPVALPWILQVRGDRYEVFR